MMQCVFLMGLMTISGHSTAIRSRFGGSAALDRQRQLLVHAKTSSADGPSAGPQHRRCPSTGIPLLTHMLFQGMFFIITPALICGAFAERMKFSTMVVFSFLWGTLVYCPLGHWVWGGGILAYHVPNSESMGGGARLRRRHGRAHQLGRLGADLCLVIGKRAGFGQRADAAAQPDLHRRWAPPCCGSAGSASTPAALGCRRHCRQRFRGDAFRGGRRRRSPGPLWNGSLAASRRVLGACSGAVAGLVCITPAAGYVNLDAGDRRWMAAGVVCYFACTTLKSDVRLRRLARRVRRPRRRRNAGRRPHGRVRHPGRSRI